MKIRSIVCIALLVCLVSPQLSYAGFLPYGRMFRAVKDDRSYTTQAQDTRLQLKLKRVLLMDAFSSLTDVSCYVYQGHGFLVGEVDSDSQREELLNCAQEVAGLNGVSYFLPLKKIDSGEGDSTLEVKLTAMLEPDFPSSQVSLLVVQNTVVILGVLTAKEQEQALTSLKKACGNKKIINFLQSPKPEDSKILRPRPLERLFE